MKNSASSDVPRLETDTASRGSNLFIVIRPLPAGRVPPTAPVGLEKFAGLYLSAPGGMLTWIGIYPLLLFARLLKVFGSAAVVVVGGGTGLRGLELPEEFPLVRPLSRLVNLAIRLGALAFFLGRAWAVGWAWELTNGWTTGSGGGGTLRKKSNRLSSCGCARLCGLATGARSSSSSSSLRSMA